MVNEKGLDGNSSVSKSKWRTELSQTLRSRYTEAVPGPRVTFENEHNLAIQKLSQCFMMWFPELQHYNLKRVVNTKVTHDQHFMELVWCAALSPSTATSSMTQLPCYGVHQGGTRTWGSAASGANASSTTYKLWLGASFYLRPSVILKVKTGVTPACWGQSGRSEHSPGTAWLELVPWWAFPQSPLSVPTWILGSYTPSTIVVSKPEQVLPRGAVCVGLTAHFSPRRCYRQEGRLHAPGSHTARGPPAPCSVWRGLPWHGAQGPAPSPSLLLGTRVTGASQISAGSSEHGHYYIIQSLA